MVDREVEWPVWVVLGRSWGFCVRSWAALGAYVGGLGAVLGPMLAILSCSWGLCVGSWAALGANVRGPRPSWDLCWRSSAALGAYVVGPGQLLGPMLAVLGRSWGLSWRSWPLLGPPKAVLGRDQGRKAAQTRKSGFGPSGKAIWQADQGRKVAQTRTGRAFWGGNGKPTWTGPGPSYAFFLIDIRRPPACQGATRL